jgi:hypothetical protein
MSKEGSFGIKKKWSTLTCLHFNLSFSFCLFSPRIPAMDERKRNGLLLLGLYMFLYMIVKHVVAIQTLILQGEWEKIAILSLINEIMGRRERSIWSKNGWHDV